MPDDYSADIQTTGAVTVGGTVEGTIDSAGDRDWFAVEFEAGRTYTIDLRGSPTGDGTLSDPYLYGIHDANNLLSGTTNDDGGSGRNSQVTFTAATGGTYYVAAGAKGNNEGTYTLSVTDTTPPPDDFADTAATAGIIEVGGSVTGEIGAARDFDWFALDAIAGHTYVIDLEGSETDAGTLANPQLRGLFDAGGSRLPGTTNDRDGGEGLNSRMTWTAGETGTVYVVARGHKEDTGTYTLSVTDTTPPDDFGATAATAGAIEVGGSVTGEINSPRDFDWFALGVVAGRTYVIDLEGSETDAGTLANPQLRGLFDAGSRRLPGTTNDRDGGESLNSRMTWTAGETGTVYVAARGHKDDTGTYTLSVTDITPQAQEQDAANASPAFTEASYAFELAENADGGPFGIALGEVRATDPDGDAVTYSIVSGAAGRFAIDAETGALSYVGTGENSASGAPSYDLTVRASDGVLHSDVTVTVNVTDVEEHVIHEQVADEAPVFGQASYEFSLAENTDGSTSRVSLGVVAASDAVEYSIAAGNGSGLFEIDAGTGELFYVGSGEDYESDTTSFDLTVRASDGEQTTDTTVTVNVTDVDEQEDDFSATVDTTGSVEVGGTTTGEIQSANDQDWFAVELEAGRTYQIELRGLHTFDGTLNDPYLRGIHDADGNLISGTTNDDGGHYNNSHLTFTATDSGTYYIAAGGESSQGTYEVEVWEDDFSQSTETTGTVEVGGTASGEIHRASDHDWFAVELEAGKAYQIDLSGVRSGGGTLNLPHLRGVYDADGIQIPGIYSPFAFAYGFQNPHNRLIEGVSSVDIQMFRGEDSQAFFTPDEDGTYYLELGNLDFISTGTYTVGVTEVEDDFLRTVDTTGTVAVGGTVTGEIQYPNDRDWFAVELTAGVTYKLGLSGEADDGGTLPEPWIRGIHDANGSRVSDTTYFASDPGSNSELIFRPTEDGTYYVAAGSYMSNNREEEIGTYTLQVSIDDTRVDPTGTSEPAGGDLAADTSTIGRVAVGGSVFGEIGAAADRDWFAVELEAGKTYRINTDGVQSGGGTLPRGRLYNVYDADGNAIPGVDDEPITWLPIHGANPRQVRNMDGLAFFTPDEDGTYYLEVGSGYFEVPFGGSTGTGTYTVSVAEMEDDFSASIDTTGTVEVGGTATGESQYEIDRDWFAVELTAGETYKVELLGASAKGGTLHQPYIWGIHDAEGHLIGGTSDYRSGPHSGSQVFFTPDEDGTYYVAAGNHESGSLASDVGTYTLQVSIDDFTDDIHTTGTLEVGGSVTGEIEAQGDRDWFAVTLEAGKTYQVDMEGSATDGGTLDNPTLYPLRDANGNDVPLRIGSDRDSGEGLNSRATFTVDEDGTYYVVALSGGHMYAVDSHGRSIGSYTLSVEELVDAI